MHSANPDKIISFLIKRVFMNSALSDSVLKGVVGGQADSAAVKGIIV